MKNSHKNILGNVQNQHRLIIDFGNTLSKTAIFHGNRELEVKTNHELSVKYLEEMVEKYSPSHAIVSNVVTIPPGILEFLQSNLHFIALNHNTPVPIHNKYKTPETLGLDRLALAVASADMFPNHNVLAIDAGTCITFDFTDGHKNYLGGGISLGINMRFKALHTFTERLPLVKNQNFGELTGSTTQESILSGVLNGVIAEFDGIIRLYQDAYADLKVVVTGGDMNFFAKKLKSNIFASPNLVLKGLNVILNFNVEKERAINS
ncbi:MAG: type III pantothenate kinase [Bacteroidales bacterium]|nr:type III pantothenate kinase [Bacteroidales bacterium]